MKLMNIFSNFPLCYLIDSIIDRDFFHEKKLVKREEGLELHEWS